LCRTDSQNSGTVPPSGTGRSIASSVIAMATTASENKVSRSVARDSASISASGISASGTRRLSPEPRRCHIVVVLTTPMSHRRGCVPGLGREHGLD
jgi:hypothetical protein